MKKSILWILLESVFLVIFNSIFFMLCGAEHPSSVWISYAFIHFSYIMVIVTPLLVRKSSRSELFGATLASVSTVYFFVEFIIGLIFIIMSSKSYKAALMIQLILAGVYAVILLMNMIANEHTAESLEKHEGEVAFIKKCSSRVKYLMGKISDKKVNKELEKLYDLLHSSPAKSNDSVSSLEIEIESRIVALEGMIRINDEQGALDVCKQIMSFVEKRNETLKTSN